MKVQGKSLRAIWLHPEDFTCVQIIDQRALPHRLVIEDLRSVEDMIVAIRDMHLRGAPLIGAAAAYGIYLACLEAAGKPNFEALVLDAAARLQATRPTAVNLAWGLKKQLEAISKASNKIEKSLETAKLITDHEVEVCRLIGTHGLPIIQTIAARKGGGVVNIMTHCNAGWLACVDWGTATAPIYQAHDQGIKVHVWVSETRPRNQGASLTAWELEQHGVPYTLIADNAAGHLMQHGRVDVVIVGTDRTTASGDVANKIGTYLKALAAMEHGVPFYAAVPSSSIDWMLHDGVRDIPIEERSADEIKWIEGMDQGTLRRVQITLPETNALNFGFDVTPARFITGLITERGVAQADEKSLRRLFPETSGSAEPEDGVIKFDCDWIRAEPAVWNGFSQVNRRRSELFRMGLIGEYPNGIGYGNISFRPLGGKKFYITGTQTGKYPELSENHYTEILDYHIDRNSVSCRGPVAASSETLTHAMIYELDPGIQAVIHVHHAALWRELLNRVPTTAREVPYGTPAMAREVQDLYKNTELSVKKILVMGGHDEGIITFGATLDEAASILLLQLRSLVPSAI